MAHMQSWAYLCMRTGRQTCAGGIWLTGSCTRAQAHVHEPMWRQPLTGRLSSCALGSGSSGCLPGAGLRGRRQAWPRSPRAATGRSSCLRDSGHEVTLPLRAPSLQRVLAWDSQLLSVSSTVGFQRKCSLALICKMDASHTMPRVKNLPGSVFFFPILVYALGHGEHTPALTGLSLGLRNPSPRVLRSLRV